MDAVEELKIAYKFECEHKLPLPTVEIDPSGGSATRIRVVAGSKPKLCIPC
jgi:hypothetical protein